MVYGTCVLGRRLLQQDGGGEPPQGPEAPGVGHRALPVLEGGLRGLSGASQLPGLFFLWNRGYLG